MSSEGEDRLFLNLKSGALKNNYSSTSQRPNDYYQSHWLVDRRPMICRVCDQICSDALSLLHHFEIHQAQGLTLSVPHTAGPPPPSLHIGQSQTDGRTKSLLNQLEKKPPVGEVIILDNEEDQDGKLDLNLKL
ncbi:unnamed protein product [Cuscuta europaea]|uniref:C2H2-type domain-containing protein n=1 Tax=Cuscuta europaea TaxID=41803 RepID=A0A9P0Z3I9_CUSEU|nr:unnamed protein product [Cuscuta europaea]